MSDRNKLQKAREEINHIDAQMAKLFIKRMDAVADVLSYKKENGLPVLDANREQEVIKRNVALCEKEEYKAYYMDFLEKTMSISKDYQKDHLT